MESVRLSHEQLALVLVVAMAIASLLVHLIRARWTRADRNRDAEEFKAAAIEAEARAWRDRKAVEEWIQKQ